MAKTSIQIFKKTKMQAAVWFVGFLSVAIAVPHFSHNQFVTGPIVNAILFLSAGILSPSSAIMIGLIPSVVALSSGLLPPALAPMVPFIMISNAVLILTFSNFRKLNYWSGVFAATFFKYAFLYGTSVFVVQIITNQSVAVKAVAQMMAWPQIVTALAGGIIAFGVLKIYEKNTGRKN